MQATVFGTGSWGTGFAMLLSDAGTNVRMWGFEPEVCDLINRTHENPVYHPGYRMHPDIVAYTDPAEALVGAEIVVFAVPAQTLRANLAAWRELLPKDAILVSLMKGIEVGTSKRPTEIIAEVSGFPLEQIVAISGPNLAREIVRKQPSATVVACVDGAVAGKVQTACQTDYFRPYTNTDVVGVELGGSCKNVIALANGMAVGLGFGENTQAALITRGLAETARLGAALGADPQTFMGLAGMGDLVATCTSALSRNRTFGERMGKGETVQEIADSTRQVAEGVKSCESILSLARSHGVEVPIIEHVAKVIRNEMQPREMVRALMTRPSKPEFATAE